MLSVAPVFIVFTHESLYGDWYPRNAVKRINQKAVKHLEIEFFSPKAPPKDHRETAALRTRTILLWEKHT